MKLDDDHKWNQEHFTGFYTKSYFDKVTKKQVQIPGYFWGFRIRLDQLIKNYQMQIDWREYYEQQGDLTTCNRIDRTIFNLEKLIKQEKELMAQFEQTKIKIKNN